MHKLWILLTHIVLSAFTAVILDLYIAVVVSTY